MEFVEWLKTRGGQLTAAFVALLLIALAVLALAGFGTASIALFMTAGYLIGAGFAYLLVSLLSRWGWLVTFAVIVTSWFTLLFLDLLVLRPRGYGFFTDLDTVSGPLAHGIVYGWLLRGLFTLFPTHYWPTREEARQNRQRALRGWLIVGGALLFLFALAFGAFVLLEYVVGPLVRFFA